MGLLFTYLLTYGGAAASLFNPWIGVLVYIAFAILRPSDLWYWSVPHGNYSKIIAIAVIAGWALKGFGNWNFGRGRAILMLLCGFLGWSAISALFAENSTVGFAFIEQKGKIVLPCLIAMTLCNSVARLKSLAWTIALSHSYIALEFNKSYFEGFNRLQEVGLGMDNNCLTIAFVTVIGFTFFMATSEQVLWRKLVLYFCTALMTHAVFFSFSRGGMVSLVAVGITSAIILPKTPKHYVVLALGAMVALRMAGPQVIERFSTTFAEQEERDDSSKSRLKLWGVCWQMMVKEPITGIGPDHFPMKAPDYGLPGMEAHSLWFQTGAELGFPGLLLLLSFYLMTVVRMLKSLSNSLDVAVVDPFVKFIPHMVISAFAGFLLAAQFVSLEGLEAPYYIAIFGACFLKTQSQAVPALAHPWAVPVANYHSPYPQPFMHRGQ